jgi:tRNA(Ile2) C34 agmatinyltransferase TiaS
MTGAVLDRPVSGSERSLDCGATLEELLTAALQDASANGSTECPICHTRMTSTRAGAECSGCGSRLT